MWVIRKIKLDSDENYGQDFVMVMILINMGDLLIPLLPLVKGSNNISLWFDTNKNDISFNFDTRRCSNDLYHKFFLIGQYLSTKSDMQKS